MHIERFGDALDLEVESKREPARGTKVNKQGRSPFNPERLTLLTLLDIITDPAKIYVLLRKHPSLKTMK